MSTSDATASVEQLHVVSRFESLRKVLLSDPYADHLDKPLAYWAVPSDRRLPLAFLGRTLHDLLTTPFDHLSATPGIGRKKIRSFLKLLSRAANTDPGRLPADLGAASSDGDSAARTSGSSNGFDPSAVSEVVWAQWRATVLERGLGDEPLGKFAPSLKNVTRVIWNTPLRAYTRSTLAEIRAMKTHGEKRLRAILEVFHSVHNVVAEMGRQDHLAVRIVPRRIDDVEAWLGHVLQAPGVPASDEICERLVSPLLAQVRTDAAQPIVRLAEFRLGVNGPVTSVRQAARTMGLTRARVYQLLNEVNDIMSVRWPLGRHQLYELRDKLDEQAARLDDPPDLAQLNAAVELFYPGNRRGAAGPLERASEPAEQDRPELSRVGGPAY
jgi:hypothetical protein